MGFAKNGNFPIVNMHGKYSNELLTLKRGSRDVWLAPSVALSQNVFLVLDPPSSLLPFLYNNKNSNIM